MIDMEKIGKFILKLRKFKGLTQNELASNLNVSHQAISKWETGTTLPDTAVLVKISEEFGITIDDILSKGMENSDSSKGNNAEQLFVRDILNDELPQEKGLIKAKFFPKLIIISEINRKGETTTKEITAPEGYTAIRGDEFTDAFPLNKYDFNGEREQIIPVINLSYQALHYDHITFIGKEEIELPDRTIVKGNHFSIVIERSGKKIAFICDVWVDVNGILLLSKIVHGSSCEIAYQKSYSSINKSGVIETLADGQYFGTTNWHISEDEENILYNIDTSMSKMRGGFAMKIEYKTDKNYNPISYIETWQR